MRRRPEVYRRRRVVALALVGLLFLGPWWLAARWGTPASPGPADAEGDPSRQVGSAAHGRTDADGGLPSSPSEGCVDAVTALAPRARLAKVLMVGVDGDDPGAVRALLASEGRPGGVFVRPGRSVWADGLLAAGAEDGLPLLVAVDDEGGRVQPLAGVLDDLPSAARLSERSAADLEGLARTRGERLRSLGVNVVFGPVVDVGGGGGIGDRSFGDGSAQVVQAAGAYARGLRAAGLLPVAKHFPGHGRADADTHEGPGAVPTLETLRGSDLVPYDVLMAEQPLGVMVGHLDVPGLTAEGVPASLSPDAIGLLRGAYEFDGLVVTDDLAAMDAVLQRFSVPEAAERALVAGVDLVLLSQPTDVGAVLDRLEDAVDSGRLPERRLAAALQRVAAVGCLR